MANATRSGPELVRDARMLLSRRLNRSLAPPDRVTVNVTLRCNLACTMCTTCYDAPELSTDEIRGIIDQTAAWGVEVFNPLGGEPFMRADIEEILAYAVQRGFYVTVTTNGTLLTARRAARLAAIPPDRLHLNISLDGDAEANDAIRGEGMWRRAVQGYSLLREADARAGNARRKILANTILHARNLDRFEAILDEQAALGLDGVQVLNLFRAGPDAPPQAADLWFRPEHHARLEALAERLARRAERQPPGGAGYRIQNAPGDLRKIPAYYRDELGPLSAPCWAGWKELYINADGKAIMCDGKLDFLAGAFGDVRAQTLQQLWASPTLAERRRVVKQCATPCVQDCYLRQRSDSTRDLARDAAGLLAERLGRRLAPLRRARDLPEATLRLELTDVAPGNLRWPDLVRKCPVPPTAEEWPRLRDQGYLDFGRGFMGFEVVRAVVADLEAARIRFGTLCVTWRGEPLLHPEVEPILDFLLARPRLWGEVRIETDGRFLTDRLLERALSAPVPVRWILDLDRAGAETQGLALLRSRCPERLTVQVLASADLDAEALRARFPEMRPAAGVLPAGPGPWLWLRREDHGHFLANAEARRHLLRAAEGLGLEAVAVDVGEEDRPRRCRAPWSTPTVSWDGKVTLCPRDVRLDSRVGEVTNGGRLSALWGEGVAADREVAERRGVPDRALCRDCALPWSPNRP